MSTTEDEETDTESKEIRQPADSYLGTVESTNAHVLQDAPLQIANTNSRQPRHNNEFEVLPW